MFLPNDQNTESHETSHLKHNMSQSKDVSRSLETNFKRVAQKLQANACTRRACTFKTGPLAFFLGSCFYRQQSWSSQAAMLTEKKK